jgi:hypothetical protein
VSESTSADCRKLPAFDTTVASPARIWNYWVGGKDNFAVDRAAGDNVLQALPALPQLARYTRLFLADVVQRLVTEHGIRQFLDIGTGLPTADNTHEVAQHAAPESRVVYADYDPLVLSHARALLISTPEGKTDYLQADLRDTGPILAGAARTLDFSQPVGILLIAVLHFVPDADNPWGIVNRLMEAVPSGSYLAIAHWAGDIQPEVAAEATRRYNERSAEQITPRNYEQVARFFDGLEMIGPGLVPITRWDQSRPAADDLPGHAGVARKP